LEKKELTKKKRASFMRKEKKLGEKILPLRVGKSGSEMIQERNYERGKTPVVPP